MRIEVPIIVVPNTELLDNHQVELAEVLAEQNYVVHGDLRYVQDIFEIKLHVSNRSQVTSPKHYQRSKKCALRRKPGHRLSVLTRRHRDKLWLMLWMMNSDG